MLDSITRSDNMTTLTKENVMSAATSYALPRAEDTTFRMGNLFVVEQRCSFTADRGHGTVVVQSANPSFPRGMEELASVDCRSLAQSYAATQGMGDPRINGNVIGPYAVNEDGIPLEDVKDPNTGQPYDSVQHPKMQPAAYRCDVKVCRRLV